MTNSFTPATINDANRLALQYMIRAPKTQSAISKAVILLHGVGSNEQDLFSFADQLPEDYYVIAARGPFTPGPGRYAWYNVDFSGGRPVFDAVQELHSRRTIEKFIAEIRKEYGIEEVYIGGFSQGAIMGLSVGLTNPASVNGIIVLSGRLLMEIRPAVNTTKGVDRLKIFIAHGILDSTLPIEYAREAKTYLEQLGVRLHYHEYTMGHQITSAVTTDLRAWLDKKN